MLNDISQIPFELITGDELPEAVSSGVAALHPTSAMLKRSSSWVMPQLLAHLGTYTFKPNPIDFLKHNIGNDPREKGIWRLLTKIPRSQIINKASRKYPDMFYYGSLVPVYLAAQKKFNSIPYSSWETDGMEHLVPIQLYSAMVATPLQEPIPLEELLHLREIGLNGHSATTFHRLTGISGTTLSKLPAFAQAMLTQIWHAHPTNRNEYMVLDPWDWDKMPEPLITSDVLSNPWDTTSDIPWL